MATPWQVMIVEDEPEVAGLYVRAIATMSRFAVAGVAHDVAGALDLLRRRPVDLVLLDLHLGADDGLTLLRRMRADGGAAEVIALTASNDPMAVRILLQHGAIDYLVKPFPQERLRQALGLFLNRSAALSGGALDQGAIDRACASGRPAGRWLPKGLEDGGVQRVRAALDPVAGSSAADVADRTRMARVTARRYLEYLVATEQATVDSEPDGPGRPRKLYRATGGGGAAVAVTPSG
jgi:response regulator of citrate/malate metabolism